MKTKWCWRCKIDVPMLDDEESEIATKLYSEGFRNIKVKNRQEKFKSLLDYYINLTGFNETEPNAIMHHFISIYGNECENCGNKKTK